VVRQLVSILAGIVVSGLMVMPACGQESATTDLTAQINGYEDATHSAFVGVPTDWSTRHVTYSAPEPGSDAEDKAQQDPRYWLQQIRRAQGDSDDAVAADWNLGDLPDAKPDKKKKKKAKKSKITKDWSQTLGGTGAKIGPGFFPAKYSFNTSSTSASCANDYVAFNTSLAGSATQASVMAFSNLYSSCTGTSPSVLWAYNTGGTALPSVALSLDGTQLALMQNVGTTAHLVLLKWNAGPATHMTSVTTHSNTSLTAGTFTAADVGANITGTGIPANTYITAQTGTAATISQAATGSATVTATIHAETAAAPGVPPTAASASAYRTCTAPCMFSFAFGATTPTSTLTDSNSSPFVDYGNDALYVGSDGGYLHKYSGVFLGATPAEVTTTGWPAQAATAILSGPIYDPGSTTVDVVSSYDGTSNGGRLHSLSATTGSGSALDSDQLGPTTASGANCAGTTAGSAALTLDAPILDPAAEKIYVFIGNDGDATAHSAVYQFAPGFAQHSCGLEETVGTGTTANVPVYSGSFDNIYFTSVNGASPSGNLYVCGNAGGQPTLYRVPIASNVIQTPVAITTTLATATTTCSPVTEFLNGAVDRAFLSVEADGRPAACAANLAGCVISYTITTALAAGATPSASLPETGGTSGIVVDNQSAVGGASQIYFAVLGTASAVQAAQSGL
jgi:hypothetical protein